MTSRKRLIISISVLLFIGATGVLGYVAIGKLTHEPVTFAKAAYMVAITITTIGYREVVPESSAFQAWTMVVVIFGVSAAAVAVGSVTGLFVEGEIGRLIGSRKLESRIKHLSNHVIICGFGRMGQLLTQRLIESKVPLVVIDRNVQCARQLEELSQLYIIGDASDEKTMEKAGIDHAKSLVAVLTTDADNVFVTLSARRMRPDLQIIARAEKLASEPKMRLAGADRVITTQSIGAERIANVLTRPHLVDFVDVAAQGVELEMGEFTVSNDSPIAGKSLLDSNIRQVADVIVVAIRHAAGTTCYNPSAQEIIRPGDTLITVGSSGAVSRLEAIRLTDSNQLGASLS